MADGLKSLSENTRECKGEREAKAISRTFCQPAHPGFSNAPAPGRMAAMLTAFGAENAAVSLKMMSKEMAGRVIAAMPSEFSITMLMNMSEKERMSMLNNVPPDNIGDILESMSAEEREEVIPKLGKKLRAHAQKVEKYPRHSVGRIMSPHFLAVGEESTT